MSALASDSSARGPLLPEDSMTGGPEQARRARRSEELGRGR
jgi:hypothetical protein